MNALEKSTDPNAIALQEYIEEHHPGMIQYEPWFGPEAEKLSFDEQCKIALDVMKNMDVDFANTVSIPVSQLQHAVDVLRSIKTIARENMGDYPPFTETQLAFRKIWSQTDLELVSLSSWLPRIDKDTKKSTSN